MPVEPSEQWQYGTEVIALYNFESKTGKDLAFRKGDLLMIQKATSDPNWYVASHASGGKCGIIPANYVKPRKVVTLHAMPWFHGKISRLDAERLLQPRREGLFLIRESVQHPGDYTLCVVSQGRVDHYHILYRNNALTVDEDSYFKNLDDLVKHYKLYDDGLSTLLREPLVKQGDAFGVVSVHAFQNSGWVIKKEDLHIGESIGKGDFGEVYKGTYKQQAVAIKELKDKNRGEQAFLQEASVMTSVQHENLVRLIGMVEGETLYLVTEFMSNGSLEFYLQSRGRAVITKKDLINFSTDTCAAMAYLEGKHMVHRDLAARNVLLDDKKRAKVSDFGMAKYDQFRQAAGKIPIKWTAPEALKKHKYSSKSDVWSFGVLLWEIYSFGKVPYPRISQNDVLSNVERGYRMPAPADCPPEVYSLMLQAWELEPGNRPTFEKMLTSLQSLQAVTA
ncbi:tyrosine-protein kinase CSK-like [Babylonia areolata]|uniref:tyrosine-protein kinase CSK-like n=1 Tax=Babylonia areolata TaxID=304850 RepID=UPI003FD54734